LPDHLKQDKDKKEGKSDQSSDSESAESFRPPSENTELEPDEFIRKNPDGTETKMITTVSGTIPLDFNNTKVVNNGTVKEISEII
jgi:hypothetical protein